MSRDEGDDLFGMSNAEAEREMKQMLLLNGKPFLVSVELRLRPGRVAESKNPDDYALAYIQKSDEELMVDRTAGELARERPAILYDLHLACRYLAVLLFWSDEWALEDGWQALASEVGSHLRAAMVSLESAAEKNKALLALHREDQLYDIVHGSFLYLRERLGGADGNGPSR